jgi:CRISPR-associated protein Cas2
LSADKRWRLVCYDVRDPARYRKLYKVMRGAGRTVQYSIFRCRLDDRQVQELRWKLARILSPEDRLLIVDLCPTCAHRVVSKNHVDDWAVEPESFVIAGVQAPGSAAPTRASSDKKTDGGSSG